MNRGIRTLSIFLALIVLTVVAVVAGLGLAIWDTGSTVTEVYAMAFPAKEAVIGEKQTIELSSGSIKDYNKDEANTSGIVNEPITDKLSEGALNPQRPETAGNVKDFSDGGGISGLVNPEPDVDENEEKTEEKKSERKPLAITSEISGIAKVVRAGDEEDTLVNTLPVPTQVTETDYSNIDPLENYPLPYTEVDVSYFDDALFIGDSRVAGLAMNSGTNATFYAVTSFQVYKYKTFKVVQTPNGKVPIFDVMPYDKFTKIYIKVGLNELGSVTDEPFLNAYESLINDLRVMQPRAIIYIQGILPVTQAKSQTDRVHCNENIIKRNENLKIFADTMKCYYVEAGPYFADETGALKAETTADGIHMYSKYMPQWIDALRQQAVIWPPQQ